MSTSNGVRILRELARCYAEIAADPIQEERRELWRKHLSLERTPVPIVIATGFWDMWARQAFPDAAMQCQDALFREYEKMFRYRIFQATWGDDSVFEPWVSVGAVQQRSWGNLWGVEVKHQSLGVDGAAWHFDPVIADLRDISMLSWPKHEIDEAATAARVQKLGDAIGGIVPINRDRGPIIEKWGLSAYGCCEDLTEKIDMLRQIRNLCITAIAPRANVRRCAEQIGRDYVMSWRPNPADVICRGFDEAFIGRTIRENLVAARGCHVHINLKDVYTLEGDTTRLKRWMDVARAAADGF